MGLGSGHAAVYALLSRSSTQMMLTKHHNEYTQLLRVFLAWKRRAHVQGVWRKQIAAACRVGAIFYQRHFWTQWQAHVLEKRRRRQEQATIKTTDKLVPDTTDVDASDEDSRYKINAVILLRERHYFEMWRCYQKKEMQDVKDSVNRVVRIRSLYAVRRWRDFVRRRKELSLHQQRAYFFCYFRLLKRSLNQLGRHVSIKKRERSIVLHLGKANQQRLLRNTMQKWRQKQLVHQALTLWKSFVQQRRDQKVRYGPIAEAVKRTTHTRLLQLAFNVWEKEHTRNQAQQMLASVINRYLNRRVYSLAWRRWQTTTMQLVHLDRFQRDWKERNLRRVWEAWSTWTQKKEAQNTRWRRAVRASYFSLLQKAFNGFQAGYTQHQIIAIRVDTMLDAANTRTKAAVFSRWNHFTRWKKRQALTRERALRFFQARLVKRVWMEGFQGFGLKQKTKRKLLVDARQHHVTQLKKASFGRWKEAWQVTRDRIHALNKLVTEFQRKQKWTIQKERWARWTEFARAKAARRVVKTLVQGQYEHHIQQQCFIQWIKYLSYRRWQQLMSNQANGHYQSVMLRKCFDRWQENKRLRERHREKTRAALVHWKLSLQNKVLKRWVEYFHTRRKKQHRIHEALEFRHKHVLRDGLRYWMIAALHLEEQREHQVVCTQLSHMAHIWRKVAAIARHWRYLARRHRGRREKGLCCDHGRNGRLWVQEQVNWHEIRNAQSRKTISPQSKDDKTSRSTPVLSETRSPLSEFVLLPRTRPQPRKPMEILLVQGGKEEKTRTRRHETQRLCEAAQCGFDLPVKKPFEPAPCSPVKHDDKPAISPSIDAATKRGSFTPAGRQNDHDLAFPESIAQQLDALERQVVALSKRKKEWQQSERQLEALYEQAKRNRHGTAKFQVMKEQHTARTKQWLRTKEHLRFLALEIQSLRGALQSS